MFSNCLPFDNNMDSFTLNLVNHYTLQKHHLTDDSKTNNIVQITSDIFGLHGTSATTPYFSLFARMKSFSRDMLTNELAVKKTLAR